jgi:hypothetical protein
MRYMIVAAALAQGACGQADEAADGAAAAAGVGSSGPCAGNRLPVTGVCSDANPALFLAIDSGIDTVARGCVWRTEELQTKENEALLFRAQDCTGEMWDRTVYSYVGRYVKAKLAPVPDDQAVFVVELFDVPDGETAEDVARQTLVSAPENQRDRCDTRPLTGLKVPGRAFELAPSAELAAELQAGAEDEPWEACGPNGVTMDGVQFWEGREKRALFHMVGQDQPLWDPASFTFYVKGADNRWSRSD